MKFKDLHSFFQRAIAPLKRKVQLMVGRAIITAVADSKKIQELQVSVMAEEVQEDVQSFQTYGFRSRPPAGTEAIMLSIGGNRDNPVVIATENREAKDALPDLEAGESVWYHHQEEVYLQWKGKNLEGELEKIKIENETAEFLTTLVEWIEQVIINRHITAIGPQPLHPADVIKMEEIKEKLESFKV